MSTVAMN